MSTPEISTMTRRGFLAAGAAVAGASMMLAAEEKKADPFGGFTVGVQSYSFRKFNLEQALKRIHDLGLSFAEFYDAHVPPSSSADQLQAILRLCKELKVAPVAFGVSSFTKDHDANKKIFEFGKALGVKGLSADPTPDSFDSLDKLVAEYKIPIAIHPHGPIGKDKLHRWYSADAIMKAVKDHHELIGSCLDTGHLIRAAQLDKKLDPAEEIRKMGARNFGLHLKDHDNTKKTDVVFGKGALDVAAVVKALREVKFKGWISIEYEASPDEPTKDIQECLGIFKKAVEEK